MFMGGGLDVVGQDELMVGVHWHDTKALRWNGAVAIFYPFPSGTLSLEDADLKVDGTTDSDQQGCELYVGDVDHDGLPDQVTGVYGAGTGREADVFFGWQL